MVFGKTPVALGVQVAQFDLGHAVGNLAGYKFAPAQRTLMVEQDTTAPKML